MTDEDKTIKIMVELFCRERHGRERHGGDFLCDECRELLEYARARVRQCPLKEQRTTCGKCEIHCYKPAMRQRIQEVMRYAGPRMFKVHPLLAARHLLKGRGKS